MLLPKFFPQSAAPFSKPQHWFYKEGRNWEIRQKVVICSSRAVGEGVERNNKGEISFHAFPCGSFPKFIHLKYPLHFHTSYKNVRARILKRENKIFFKGGKKTRFSLYGAQKILTSCKASDCQCGNWTATCNNTKYSSFLRIKSSFCWLYLQKVSNSSRNTHISHLEKPGWKFKNQAHKTLKSTKITTFNGG